MNRKLITAAVLVGMSGAASAVNVNSDGLGQILLYPYYTTTGGKATAVTVVNTTAETKAVKVRFSEGVNTWEVLDFNLYLSPWDVWTAMIDVDADGNPRVRTDDTSCTAPVFPDEVKDADGNVVGLSKAFVDYNLNLGDPVSTSLSNAERLAEGHLEIIEMGVVTDATMQANIKHVGGTPGGATGTPRDCEAVRNAFLTGDWSVAATRQVGINAPTGGLFGSGSIIDVADATVLSYDATAIEDFYLQSAHSYPGDAYPNLAGHYWDGAAASLVRDNAPVSSSVSTVVFDGKVYNTQWSHPSQALAATLMANNVYNTFASDSGIDAASDWVITFPNKHPFVNRDTSTGTPGRGQFGFPADTAPFAGGPSVTLSVPAYDREETFQAGSLQFSPLPAATSSKLNNEVNVLEMSSHYDRNVFDSNLAQSVDTAHMHGWANVQFANNTMTGTDADGSGASHVFYGRPVIGFSALELKNDFLADGVKARYATAYSHKYGRKIETVASN